MCNYVVPFIPPFIKFYYCLFCLFHPLQLCLLLLIHQQTFPSLLILFNLISQLFLLNIVSSTSPHHLASPYLYLLCVNWVYQ